MTDKWDPSIPEHKELAHMIEIGNGIPEMRPIAMAREALVKVGFEILHEEDLAERPDEVPWYYPLEGDVFKAQTLWDVFTCWRTSSSGKFVSHHGLRLLEFAGLVPKGTWDVCETLKIAGDALVRTGQQKVCSNKCLCSSADHVVVAVHTDVPRHQQEAAGCLRSCFHGLFTLLSGYTYTIDTLVIYSGLICTMYAVCCAISRCFSPRSPSKLEN